MLLRESYHATRKETREQLVNNPDSISTSVSAIFEPYDLPSYLTANLTAHLEKSGTDKMLDFVMSFEHTLPEPASSRAITCALTIALGYFVGGFVPLVPYFFVSNVTEGLAWSVGIMCLALFMFGYVKTCLNVGWLTLRNVMHGILGGGQMVVVGGVAAGAAMGLVRAFDYHPSNG